MLLTGVQSLLNSRFKVFVEGFHHVRPLLLTLGNLVEVLFHLCGEVIIHDGREILHEEIVDHDTNIGRQELTLIGTCHLLTNLLSDEFSFESVDGIGALLTLAVTLLHIFTLLDSRDGRCIGRRTANAQFLQLMYQRGLRIAQRPLAEALGSLYLATGERHPFLHRG